MRGGRSVAGNCVMRETPTPALIAKYLPHYDPRTIQSWEDFKTAWEYQQRMVRICHKHSAIRAVNALGYEDLIGTPLARRRTFREYLLYLWIMRHRLFRIVEQ